MKFYYFAEAQKTLFFTSGVIILFVSFLLPSATRNVINVCSVVLVAVGVNLVVLAEERALIERVLVW